MTERCRSIVGCLRRQDCFWFASELIHCSGAKGPAHHRRVFAIAGDAVTEQVARKLLARARGTDAQSSEEVAADAAEAWMKLAQHLSPLVGDAGVLALLDRSLTLTRKSFQWLPTAEAVPRDPPWTQLRDALEQQELNVAIEASVALMSTFIRLLGRFLGEALALRLLHEVWPEIATTQKETT